MPLNLKYPEQEQKQVPHEQSSNQQDSGSLPFPGFGAGYPSMNFGTETKDDLIRFQLDISQTKADISHWLNGDTPEIDERTQKPKWTPNDDNELRVLNKFGIKEVMRIVNMYLTKDVILSNLKEERINQMCQDIGDEINDLFFTKYEEIGLDTDSKKKNYSSIVLTLCHIIYITLMRAKDGIERKGVTENRNVNQNEFLGYPGMQQSRPGFLSRFGRGGK